MYGDARCGETKRNNHYIEVRASVCDDRRTIPHPYQTWPLSCFLPSAIAWRMVAFPFLDDFYSCSCLLFSVLGVFRDDPLSRSEFFQHINR